VLGLRQRLVGDAVVVVTVKRHQLQAGGVDGGAHLGLGVVALAVQLRRHRRTAPWLDRFEGEAGFGNLAGAEVGAHAALPDHPPAVHLQLELFGEEAAELGQRVGVEDAQRVRGHVGGEAAQRLFQFGLGVEVVDRVVETADEVEAAVDGQLAHVGDLDPGLVARLRPGHLRHRGRDVAGGHLPAVLEHRDEALAGATGDVEHGVAAEAICRAQLQQRADPEPVVVMGGEVVVDGCDRLIGELGVSAVLWHLCGGSLHVGLGPRSSSIAFQTIYPRIPFIVSFEPAQFL
jgi:hypothetical protein